MRVFKLNALLVVILSTSATFADIKIKLHYTSIANLVYQLDCISNALPHCSRNTYHDLWNKEFIKNEIDKDFVKNWGELMNRYHLKLEIEESKQRLMTGRFEGIQLSTKIRIASFQADSLLDYFNRLDLVVTPLDREKFEKVIKHFYSRFEKWWKRVALPKGYGFAKKTNDLLTRPDISKKINQFAKFYDVTLPDRYEVHFNLFFRPDSQEATSGQQIENYSVIEFLPSEKPIDRMDVIIHELCHFFFENAEDGKWVALQKAFERSQKPSARGAYNLISETLATTLGNGLINKHTMDKKQWNNYLTKPQSFYNDDYIDKAAKAILPWLEKWLIDAKSLYDPQFVENYISVLEQSLGNELLAPKLLLKEMVLIADRQFEGKFRDIVRKQMTASSMHISEGDWSDERILKSYREYQNVSALVIIHSSNINQLKEKNILSSLDYDAVIKVLNDKGQFIFATIKTNNVPLFVLCAGSYVEAVKLVEALARLKEGFSGVLNK